MVIICIIRSKHQHTHQIVFRNALANTVLLAISSMDIARLIAIV